MKWVNESLGTFGSTGFVLAVSMSGIIVGELVISNLFTRRYGNLLVADDSFRKKRYVMFGSRFSRL